MRSGSLSSGTIHPSSDNNSGAKKDGVLDVLHRVTAILAGWTDTRAWESNHFRFRIFTSSNNV